jgi:hypothetical protein
MSSISNLIKLIIVSILFFSLCTISYSQQKTKEVNKKSIGYFKKALDTLNSATPKNLEKRSQIALKLFDAAIKADSSNVPGFLWKSLILSNQKKYKEALNYVYTGIKKSKANGNVLLPQLYMNSGGLNLLLNDSKQSTIEYTNAINSYQEILKVNKCNMDAVANIPIIYSILNQKDKAYKFIDNNKDCYKGVNIAEFKKKIKEFDLKKYLAEMNKK